MLNRNLNNMVAKHKLLGAIVIMGVLGLSQAACAGAAANASNDNAAPTTKSTAQSMPPTQVVTVSMTNFAFKFTPPTIKAGMVRFVVKNDATDQMHEMFLVKTNLPVDKLPLGSDGVSIDETSTLMTKLGSVEDVDAGKSGEMTIMLDPGRYVFFCNKVGHYKMGMAGEMTVAP